VSVVDRQYIREEIRMGEKASFFVLRAKAVPEVLLRVVEAKRLLDSGKVESVQEATEMVQISRSSFYKYKDDIFPYFMIRQREGQLRLSFSWMMNRGCYPWY
jgi:ACT domain-containing protein